jgi:hypothetical protein
VAFGDGGYAASSGDIVIPFIGTDGCTAGTAPFMGESIPFIGGTVELKVATFSSLLS